MLGTCYSDEMRAGHAGVPKVIARSQRNFERLSEINLFWRIFPGPGIAFPKAEVIMKKLFLVTTLAFGLAAYPTFAQGRGGMRGGGMGRGSMGGGMHSRMGSGPMRGDMGRTGGNRNGAIGPGANSGRSQSRDRQRQQNRKQDRTRQISRSRAAASPQQ